MNVAEYQAFYAEEKWKDLRSLEARKRHESLSIRQAELEEWADSIRHPSWGVKSTAPATSQRLAKARARAEAKAAARILETEDAILARRVRKYGITTEEYRALASLQHGTCAICHKFPKKTYGLVVDHCHSTGSVRGLLCSKCNAGIGLLGDSTEAIKSALDYLMLGNSAR